jgi:hypothetical protein
MDPTGRDRSAPPSMTKRYTFSQMQVKRTNISNAKWPIDHQGDAHVAGREIILGCKLLPA